jgi:dephospho-CoA kinase
VALTGGIATGKSYVRGRFEALGVPTIDADALARQALAPGTPELAAVVARFGEDVLDPSGALDRKRLANIVFNDPDARRDLEAIVHPGVVAVTNAWFERLGDTVPFAIADIPLLYEVGRNRDFELVIVAACDSETQVRRVMHRDGVTEAEARQRLAAQLPIAEKVARADYVIDTSGTHEETAEQVRRVYDQLLRKAT